MNFLVNFQKHTISIGTGPEEAFRGERFLFAEMSLPRVPGDKAIIQTTVPLPGACSQIKMLLYFSLTQWVSFSRGKLRYV